MRSEEEDEVSTVDIMVGEVLLEAGTNERLSCVMGVIMIGTSNHVIDEVLMNV